jgi:hypothetical protein
MVMIGVQFNPLRPGSGARPLPSASTSFIVFRRTLALIGAGIVAAHVAILFLFDPKNPELVSPSIETPLKRVLDVLFGLRHGCAAPCLACPALVTAPNSRSRNIPYHPPI